MFHPLSHTIWNNPFYRAETAPNSALKSSTSYFWSTVSKRGTHFEQSVLCSNVHTKWWIHSLLISLRCQLSHAISIHDWPKPFCGRFLCFLEQLRNLGDPSLQYHRYYYWVMCYMRAFAICRRWIHKASTMGEEWVDVQRGKISGT